MASVSPKHDTHPLIAASGAFTVSILAGDQVDAGQYFSYPGRRFRYIAPEYLAVERGHPVVPGAIAWLHCEVIDRVHVLGGRHGFPVTELDHELFFGRVVDVGEGRLREPPLLYSSRLGWRVTGDKAREPVEFLGAQFDAGAWPWVHFPEGGRRPRPVGPSSRRWSTTAWPRRAPRAPGPQPDRPRHGRPDHRHPRLRRPEAPLPAPAVHRRGDLVPAVQRARRRLRRGRLSTPPSATATSGSSTARRCGPPSPTCPVGDARRPHRPRPAQAQGPDLLRGRHARPRRRGPPAAPDDRRGRVQRGLLHRRAHPRRRAPRRRRRGLARRAHHAHERAGRHRRRHPAGARGIIARRQAPGRDRPRRPGPPDELMRCGSGPRCSASPTSGPASCVKGTPAPRARSARSCGRAQQGITSFAVDLLGAEGMLYELRDGPPGGVGMLGWDCPQQAFLRMPGQLHRGRHHRGDEEHPRRAGARPARRRPGRQGSNRSRPSTDAV
jgi:flavin reductase (DIM6/NTAB) family NADH-FMN oxidoreductase RutF